jgi:capsular polysaccharide export protein
LSGFDVRVGKPNKGDLIGVWGKSPTSPRGEAVSDLTGQPILRVEDAFLRSLHPGRDGEPPIGLLLDEKGVHFDASQPSDLETLLATHPFDDTPLLNRAREGIARLQQDELSKYTAHDPEIEPPEAGYVLVIDQTKGDASIKYGGANEASFQEMLYYAQTEHATAKILVKTHPETMNGHRQGHFTSDQETDRIRIVDTVISPWKLMEGAIAVYVVSSQLGFEAILAGHKPIIFGQPFYAGWGLSDDRNPVQRRQRVLTRAQLFAGTMLLYPKWIDPCTDRLCDFETALNQLSAQTRAWREDHRGWLGQNIRQWKRKHFQQFFGETTAIRFKGNVGKPLRWGRPNHIQDGQTIVEDGFLRSRGLGADLVPPMSLVLDDRGIYFDPTRASRLETLISQSPRLRQGQLQRAAKVIGSLTTAGLSKYNISGRTAELPDGLRILVPGQVEDDASVKYGCSDVKTNLELLKAARAENPDAVIIYKPHPDVEKGLRQGAISDADLAEFSDIVAREADINQLLGAVDEVWTMTSLTGFEALIRGVKVTCLGAPFYAGWGLTTDLGKTPVRRQAQPTLEGLVHATLIDYPRYRDPISGLPCAVETVIERLANSREARVGVVLRLLSKLQGLLASQAWLWR